MHDDVKVINMLAVSIEMKDGMDICELLAHLTKVRDEYLQNGWELRVRAQQDGIFQGECLKFEWRRDKTQEDYDREIIDSFKRNYTDKQKQLIFKEYGHEDQREY